MIPEIGDPLRGDLEDFWERQDNAPSFGRTFLINGWPARILANHTGLLQIGALTQTYYSRAPERDEPAWRIQFVVQAPLNDPGDPPEYLTPAIRYTGSGDWIHMDLGGWGSVFADLAAGWAVVILAPSLASRPDLICRSIMLTLVNNFLTRHGYGMLHATGLVDGARVLLLMAPHNSGKSTTALRLSLDGPFRLLSDSQIYITQTAAGIQVTGFPVGRGKLRKDMLPQFPQLTGLLSPERVRDETKFVLDLRALDPGLVQEEAIFPADLTWCLVRRTGQTKTRIRPANPEEIWQSLLDNSLHDDRTDVWLDNLAQIEPLAAMARFYHLELGTDGAGVVEEVVRFWSSVG